MNKNLSTDFQTYIHISKYSRFDYDKGRRETWEETVDRYISFTFSHLEKKFNYKNEDLKEELRSAILNQEVMPSMRGLMTAGKALERDNVAIYNCAYLPIDNVKAFDETMYMLSCGTGVGFSVERQYINKLPDVPEELYDSETTVVFTDSKIGWAKGFREFLSILYSGQIPRFDTTKIRSRGSILKTFGGRASGPEPLIELLKFTIDIFKRSKGRKLSSIEVHDLECKIGDCIVSGGVRRSALISLSNLSDDRMRNAKSGNWYESNQQRALANNSVAYTEKPDMNSFIDEWSSLYKSKSGERGIIYRKALNEAVKNSIAFRKNELKEYEFDNLREVDFDWGVNPCAEIILRPNEFCNLSEVIVRPDLTLDELNRRVRLASILGTIQSTFTDFRYINNKWKKNVEEERLLGVSLTGIMSHEILNNMNNDDEKLIQWLTELRKSAIISNFYFAKELGINHSSSVTCVKPSGTVSSLNGTPPGIHSDHSEFYIRRVREDKTSPVSKMLIEQGVPYESDVMKKDYVNVFSFPIKAPSKVFKKDVNAIRQLELWKIYQLYWCDHKPSITVDVAEDEWMEVGAWVYKNFEYMSGVSFLPKNDHIYTQAPYEEISEEKYNQMVKEFPKIQWGDLSFYESEDFTTGSQELACTGGSCDIL